jgi:hypothetical protein
MSRRLIQLWLRQGNGRCHGLASAFGSINQPVTNTLVSANIQYAK